MCTTPGCMNRAVIHSEWCSRCDRPSPRRSDQREHCLVCAIDHSRLRPATGSSRGGGGQDLRRYTQQPSMPVCDEHQTDLPNVVLDALRGAWIGPVEVYEYTEGDDQ